MNRSTRVGSPLSGCASGDSIKSALQRFGLVYAETFDDIQIISKVCALCLLVCFMWAIWTWDCEMTVLFGWNVRCTEFYLRPTCTGMQGLLRYNQYILWQIENNWRMWNISNVSVECTRKIKSRIVYRKQHETGYWGKIFWGWCWTLKKWYSRMQSQLLKGRMFDLL